MTQKSPKPNFWASNFSEAWDITHWLSTPWKTHFCDFFILLIIKQLQARQNTNAEIRIKYWYSAYYKYWLKIMDTHIGNTGLFVKILTYILVYSRNTCMATHAVILSAAKDLLDDNQTMAATKNGDLDSSHRRWGKPIGLQQAPPFQTEGFGEDCKHNRQ